jgi:ABC-type oligopeptide transport system substrate-binding subunit
VQPAGGRSVAGTVRKGGTLRLAGAGDVGSLDPALTDLPAAWRFEFATCAKLFNLPDEEGAAGTRVIPEVAAGFPRVSKDGKTYTFDLKRTFRFHKGAPVTAASFAVAFNRDANPKLRSPAVNYMHQIVGADAVLAGKATTVSGVRVLGRYRLQVRLTKPLGDLVARLTMPFFCPLLPNTPIDPAGIDNPPGSGPYYVAERIVNRRIVLKRNPFYPGTRPANLDQVVYTPGVTSDACRAAVEQDRVDLCLVPGFPDAAYREIRRRYGINRMGGRFFVSSGLKTWFFAFNHDRLAFKGADQIPLAKAINYAIDRPALARTVGYLAAGRTDQILPPAFRREASIYPIRGADPATARRWLERARFKPAKLVLYTGTDPVGYAVAELFAFDLKQIGIDVEVKYFSLDSLYEKAGTRGEPFDVVVAGWGADYPDAATFFEPLLNGANLRETGNKNLSYLDDPKVNARIAVASRLTGETRRNAWAELDVDLMRTNPPWAPFINFTDRVFVSKSFGCFLFHPVYGVDLAAACKK